MRIGRMRLNVGSSTILYGPVLSWRLGRSLGIDMVVPPKACSFECVYCQLGATTEHICSREQFVEKRLGGYEQGLDELVRLETELEERSDVLRETSDVVTFSGYGEPTLSPMLYEAAHIAKKHLKLPVVLLTNSSFLNISEVSDRLQVFDVVEAKLDAVSDDSLKLINSPCEGTSVDDLIDGIRKVPKRSLVLQSMFLKLDGVVYPSDDEFLQYLDVVHSINPRRVEVNTPWRPPRDMRVSMLDDKTLRGFENQLLDAGIMARRYKPVETYTDKTTLPTDEEKARLIEALGRRPMRTRDMLTMTFMRDDVLMAMLNSLAAEGLLVTKFHEGEIFYMVKEGA